jgi:hypothetical protein
MDGEGLEICNAIVIECAFLVFCANDKRSDECYKRKWSDG